MASATELNSQHKQRLYLLSLPRPSQHSPELTKKLSEAIFAAGQNIETIIAKHEGEKEFDPGRLTSALDSLQLARNAIVDAFDIPHAFKKK